MSSHDAVCEAKTHKLDLTIKLANGQLVLVKDPKPFQIRWPEKLLPSELACLRSFLVRPGFDRCSEELIGELFVALFCRPKMREEDFECLSQVRPDILERGLVYIITREDQEISGTLFKYSNWYTKVLEKSVWTNIEEGCIPLFIFENCLAQWWCQNTTHPRTYRRRNNRRYLPALT